MNYFAIHPFGLPKVDS